MAGRQALVMAVIALVATRAAAQGGAEQTLTGGASRAWVLQSAAGNCPAGARYTFARTHVLTVDGCGPPQLRAWSLAVVDGRAVLGIEGLGRFRPAFDPPNRRPHRLRLDPLDGTGAAQELELPED